MCTAAQISYSPPKSVSYLPIAAGSCLCAGVFFYGRKLSINHLNLPGPIYS